MSTSEKNIFSVIIFSVVFSILIIVFSDQNLPQFLFGASFITALATVVVAGATIYYANQANKNANLLKKQLDFDRKN